MAREWRGGEEGMVPESDDNPPEGFVFSKARGPYTSHNGPFFHKVTDDAFWHGFRARQHHLNGHGIVHGGLLMSFADGLMGTAVWRKTKARAVTMRMTSDLLDMVRPGEWVEGTAHVVRAARTVAFVKAEVTCGKRKVLTANGVFKLLGSYR